MKRRGLLSALLVIAASSGCARDEPAGSTPDRPSERPATGGAGGAPAARGGSGGGPASMAGAPGTAFEALPVHVGAEKVKSLLTGLPLSSEELASVSRDSKALRTLVDRWMGTPEWRAKMMEFWKHAFQQTQVGADDYVDLLGTQLRWNPTQRTRFLRSAEESFARTALALVEEGRPFTEVVTTPRFMMSPPLMAIYAYLDAMPLNDEGKAIAAQVWPLKKVPGFRFEITSNSGVPIPYAESIDPASPNYLRFHAALPPAPAGKAGDCPDPEISKGVAGVRDLMLYLFGGRLMCPDFEGQFTDADWNDWRMVTIRRPKAGEDRTLFWDLPRLRDRATTELVLSTPRVGFMTTLAFFANWPTNASNAYRVTVNQALIVALGRSFDDSGTTVQLDETSIDDKHVQPGTACYGCHVTLDPMRDFWKQSFALNYHTQYSDKGIPAQGVFTVDGSAPVSGNGVGDFARAVAGHERFAPAWAGKLCQFANAAPCDPEDPEFVRIAAAFRASKFDFKVLVRELFSSPLVTFAAPTESARKSGVAMSISRRESLCAALEARLGLVDVCNLRGESALATRPARTKGQNLALGIPGAGYARGDEKPLFPHDPNLFFHAATENLCALLAAEVVDGANSRFPSNRPEQAIAALVATVMGLPEGDPRAPGMREILKAHHAEALQAGSAAREAMQSTFVLACQAPTAITLGL